MRKRMVVVEGSYAVAHAVKVCKPNVISAYPITPQTHIVEDLAQFVADGEINCEYMNVESEFSAISALIGQAQQGRVHIHQRLHRDLPSCMKLYSTPQE